MTQSGALYGNLLFFVVMIAVFYFLLIRPQQVQQKKRREMLNSLRKGNQIITIGGLYGEIVDLRDDNLTLKIADKVNVRLSRSAVSSVLGKEPKEKEKEQS